MSLVLRSIEIVSFLHGSRTITVKFFESFRVIKGGLHLNPEVRSDVLHSMSGFATSVYTMATSIVLSNGMSMHSASSPTLLSIMPYGHFWMVNYSCSGSKLSSAGNYTSSLVC